jgi:hypothetical protein
VDTFFPTLLRREGPNNFTIGLSFDMIDLAIQFEL